MAVYKRGAKGVFYMDFVCKGVRVFRSTETHTKREAKLVEAAERQKIVAESKLSPSERAARLQLSEAITQVYEGKWKQNKDAEGANRRAKGLIEHIGDIPIGKIDDDIVAELIKKLEATGIKPATINRYLATLKTILRYKRQPWDHIKLKKVRNGRIRVVSQKEEQAAVNMLRNTAHSDRRYFYPEVADLVEVLVDTGMRLSELLHLTYDDVNFKSNMISIWINKGDRPRSIPMTSRVKRLMKARQEANPAKPFNVTVYQADKAWEWVRDQMGLKEDKEFVLHALRHSCASRLVNRGIDLYVVKEWLGHSSIQVTEKYAHLNPEKLSHAANMLEQNDEHGQ